MRKTKTREEIVKQAFLNRSDISKALQVSLRTANKIYDISNQIDQAELEYRVEPDKVRITTVCKVVGVSIRTIQNAAKGSEEK